MKTEFNLINSCWIPVIPIGSDQPVQVGILEAIVDAAKFRSVSASTPIETAATYRLLLAVTHAALDINDYTWKQIWRDGTLARSDIEEYLGKWSYRFDLFDKERPFYQDGKLRTKFESISSLRGHVASGADSTLFDHNTQQQKLTLPAGDASLALLSIQNFGLGGTKGAGKSFYDAPCARGIVLFVEGESLFETLVLNLVDRDMPYYRLKKRSNDRPGWEMEEPFLDDPERPFGLLDHLTWHNRRVRLVADEHTSATPMVSQMMYDIGLRSTDQYGQSVRDVFNPMHYWRVNTRKGTGGSTRSHSPLYFVQGKALWRDSNVLFQTAKSKDDDADKPPAALEQVQTLANEGLIEWAQTYRLLGLGACTEPGQDKTYFYRFEVLPLPPKLLINPDLVSELSSALRSAENAAKALQGAIFLLALLILYPTTKDTSFDTHDKVDDRIKKGKNTKSNDRDAQQAYKLSTSWGTETCFWSDLEPYFHRFIEDLPTQTEDAVKTWRQAVRRAAESAFNRSESYAGGDLRAQRAIALARQQFNTGLAASVGKASATGNSNGDDKE